MSSQPISLRFPEPDRLLRYAFGQLRVAQYGTDAEKQAQLRGVHPTDLPRPWDPPSCPPALRKHLWDWLDDVAAWINHEYLWQVEKAIPSCWPAHPHIAHELPVVASLRYTVTFSCTPDALEDWHRYTLPGFLDRTATRLGMTGCPPGKHADWPAGGRYRDFTCTPTRERRAAMFAADQRSSTVACGETRAHAASSSGGGNMVHPPLKILGRTRTQPREDQSDG